MKPGQKTSEFWVVVLTSLSAGLAAAAGRLEGWVAAIVAGAGAAAFAISRGLAKSGEAAANVIVPSEPDTSERKTPKDLPAHGAQQTGGP
jgi:malic enzyme